MMIIGILSALIALIIAVIVFFANAQSPLKNQFNRDVQTLMAVNRAQTEDVFTEEDFIHLPKLLQKYFKTCGYIGKAKSGVLQMVYKDVEFKQAKDKKLNIAYTHYDFAALPTRLAMINASKFGIPFQGYDAYYNNQGEMKGVIAYYITLFDQKGADMDKAALITYLAESIFLPLAMLKDNFTFEQIGNHNVKASIQNNNIKASGIFTFNDEGEMIRFYTEERACIKTDGTVDYIPWSVNCKQYILNDNGIKYPKQFKAIWHHKEEDFTYFDGIISLIQTY